jgi:hypothetical protein
LVFQLFFKSEKYLIYLVLPCCISLGGLIINLLDLGLKEQLNVSRGATHGSQGALLELGNTRWEPVIRWELGHLTRGQKVFPLSHPLSHRFFFEFEQPFKFA